VKSCFEGTELVT